MQVVKIVIWQEDDAWIGYLQEYPDYWTQGETLDDPKDHLKDLHADLSGGIIPGARRVEDLGLSGNEWHWLYQCCCSLAS